LVTPDQKAIVDDEVDPIFLSDELCTKTLPRAGGSHEGIGLDTAEKKKDVFENTDHSVFQYTLETADG